MNIVLIKKKFLLNILILLKNKMICQRIKKNAVLALEIEEKTFQQLKNQDKQGSLPKGFYAEYKVSIQKAWIREREAFMGEQKIIRKQVGEMLNKKG